MIDQLKGIFSDDRVKTDKDSLEVYGKDWTKHIESNASAVVFPKTTEEVQSLVLWARENKKTLLPSGGRTGLSGAATAIDNEVVVSFEKMSTIKDFNEVDQTVVCEAGVITEALQNFALEKDLFYPVDFAARGSSQLGGNVATNAGGIKVLRYGLTRQWVTGLKVVTGKGDVLNLNQSLIKNASGYDFRHLFIGSEGTLGFVTEVTIQLTQPPKDLSVFMFGLQNLEDVLKLYKKFKFKLPLTAFEMFTDVALKYVLTNDELHKPFETPSKYYVLVEVENTHSEIIDEAMALFEESFEKGWVEDGVVSQNQTQSQELWRLREDISEATSAYDPYKNDISVRVSQVTEFLTEMDEILCSQYSDIEVVWFGHIGDGNLHINILKPSGMETDKFIEKCKSVNTVLFQMIEKFKGSISAEHGVGFTKKADLSKTRSLEEIEYMKEIKKVFDPDGILSPEKLIP